MFFLLWFSPTVGECRLWERLRIYSGKYLFNKSKFYLEKLLISPGCFSTCRIGGVVGFRGLACSIPHSARQRPSDRECIFGKNL